MEITLALAHWFKHSMPFSHFLCAQRLEHGQRHNQVSLDNKPCYALLRGAWGANGSLGEKLAGSVSDADADGFWRVHRSDGGTTTVGI